MIKKILASPTSKTLIYSSARPFSFIPKLLLSSSSSGSNKRKTENESKGSIILEGQSSALKEDTLETCFLVSSYKHTLYKQKNQTNQKSSIIFNLASEPFALEVCSKTSVKTRKDSLSTIVMASKRLQIKIPTSFYFSSHYHRTDLLRMAGGWN